MESNLKEIHGCRQVISGEAVPVRLTLNLEAFFSGRSGGFLVWHVFFLKVGVTFLTLELSELAECQCSGLS